MIALGILAGVVSVIGIATSVRLVSTDGQHRVPTRTYPHQFDLR